MKAKTEELLYLLLWTCERLVRPTFRNLTDSFESWAYRKGLNRQLTELERRALVESSIAPARGRESSDRILRLTEAGRLHALGGRDPEACWLRSWDGRWRLVLFDLPATEGTKRNRLRNFLRSRGFGWLQKSVWISPHPLKEQRALLAESEINVESLLFLEARPSAGETDEEIVSGAWDFEQINLLYSRYRAVIEAFPSKLVLDKSGAEALLQWAAQERIAWLGAISVDPLLPQRLLPQGYRGQAAWRLRIKTLRLAAMQMHAFRAHSL
jgi:phenylacetic acid degradation operon negative regulatory protein